MKSLPSTSENMTREITDEVSVTEITTEKNILVPVSGIFRINGVVLTGVSSFGLVLKTETISITIALAFRKIMFPLLLYELLCAPVCPHALGRRL